MSGSLHNMKFKYIVLVVSLASLALLYLLTGLSQPPTIALTDAPHYEGQHVIVTGRVQHYQPTSNGAQLIIINAPDTETTLTIYTTQPTAIDYGDLVVDIRECLADISHGCIGSAEIADFTRRA